MTDDCIKYLIECDQYNYIVEETIVDEVWSVIKIYIEYIDRELNDGNNY